MEQVVEEGVALLLDAPYIHVGQQFRKLFAVHVQLLADVYVGIALQVQVVGLNDMLEQSA